jgi:hypothetical protein
MSSRIQRIYSTLVRSLDLREASQNYVLLDEVRPVVILHEHCEGVTRGFSVTNVGALAAGDLAVLDDIAAGAYSVSGWMFGSTAVALVGALESVLVTDRPRGIAAATIDRIIFRLDFGNAARQANNFPVLIPKYEIHEGRELAIVLTSALIANDAVSVGLVLQPI